MGNLYGSVKHGDEISPGWMQDVEDAVGVISDTAYPTQSSQYTMFQTGSKWYARNGTTGKIDDDDTVWDDLANRIILDMYDSGSGSGGKLLVKASSSNIDQYGTINMRPGIYIEGEGRGVSGPPSVAIFAQNDIPLFKFAYPDSGKHYYGGLRNLRISGKDEYGGTQKVTSHPLVDINPSIEDDMSDIDLFNVTMICGKYGLRIYNTTTAKAIWNVHLDNCFLEGNTNAGLYIESTTDQTIKQCKFRNNHFWANCSAAGNGALEVDGHECRGNIFTGNTMEDENRHAIYMADEADHWILNDNIIINASSATDNTYSGIKLVDVDYITIKGTQCVKIGSPTNEMKYGIETDNNCTYCNIQGNTVDGKTAGMLKGSGAGMIVRHNVGFITENSGSDSIASGTTSKAVAHGLAVTPSAEHISIIGKEDPTNAVGTIWVDTIGATNFTVNVENDPGASNWDFGWKVIVL